MAGSSSSSSSSSVVPSLPPPRPKSPPEYPDLYGKRRELAKGELKFVGNLQPASQCWLLISWWQIQILSYLQVKRLVGLVISGSGYAEHHVLTSHGFAVLGALLILKCRTAAIAIYATAVHVFIVVQYQNAHVVQYQNADADADADVQYQNADVVLGHAPNALTRSRAARATSNVAFHDDALPAQIALVDGDALVPNVQSGHVVSRVVNELSGFTLDSYEWFDRLVHSEAERWGCLHKLDGLALFICWSKVLRGSSIG
ncbi:unnamed protein product [Camellia sinensis]